MASQPPIPTSLPWVHKRFVDSQATLVPDPPSHLSRSPWLQNPDCKDSQAPPAPYPPSHPTRPRWLHNYYDEYNPSTPQASPSKPDPRSPKYSYAPQSPEPIFPLPPPWKRGPIPNPYVPVPVGEHNIDSCHCYSCRASRGIRKTEADGELKEINKVHHPNSVAKSKDDVNENVTIRDFIHMLSPMKTEVNDDVPAVIPKADSLSAMQENKRQKLATLEAKSRPLPAFREGPNVDGLAKVIPTLTLSPNKAAVNDGVPTTTARAGTTSEIRENKRRKSALLDPKSRPLDTVKVGQLLTRWLEEGGNGAQANLEVIQKIVPGPELWTCRVWRWIEGLEE